ncbi:hypothetical protein [Subtercola vilae]|uniref:Uncharacterized protein n=1 Tax=Subtercola vilae TaxID=2056433 RepID=A0A4T2BTG2_9MICO|nr:hypothetical protein [Subtercola vilae]TIH34955.1 hypothetical protein D4765_11720 [Subtercola vilae]
MIDRPNSIESIHVREACDQAIALLEFEIENTQKPAIRAAIRHAINDLRALEHFTNKNDVVNLWLDEYVGLLADVLTTETESFAQRLAHITSTHYWYSPYTAEQIQAKIDGEGLKSTRSTN